MTCNCFGTTGLPVPLMLGLEVFAVMFLAGVYVRISNTKWSKLFASMMLGAVVGSGVVWGASNLSVSSQLASVLDAAVVRFGYTPATVTPIVDIGVTPHGKVARAILEVSNQGDKPISLLGISREFGLRSPLLPYQLAPGVTAKIPVSMRVNRAGPFISNAIIYTNHVEAPRLRAIVCGKSEHPRPPLAH